MILAVGLVSVLILASSCCDSKTIKLFNGKDLSGWAYYAVGATAEQADEIYSVKDGVIHITGEPFGCMYTVESYSDYELHVEWRWPNAENTPKNKLNSGIFVHVQPEHKLWPNAIECQLFNGRAGDFVLLGGSDIAEFVTPEGEERPAYPVVSRFSEGEIEKPLGEWNTANIRCEGDRITVIINGTLENVGTQSMHSQGSIALQCEGAPIEFRNVTLTSLK